MKFFARKNTKKILTEKEENKFLNRASFKEFIRKTNHCKKELLDIVYPLVCGACSVFLEDVQKSDQWLLCAICAEGLLRNGPESCSRCASPLSNFKNFAVKDKTQNYSMDSHDLIQNFPTSMRRFNENGIEGQNSCGDCARLNPYFEKTYAAWIYGGPLLEAIQNYKYHGWIHLAEPMAQLMMKGLYECDAEIIIPVPAHRKRLKERKFDHCLILARETGRIMDIPHCSRVLSRIRHTGIQAELNVRDRLQNIRGSVIASDRYWKLIQEKHVLLVDDVMTTGATSSECAKVLLKSGAKKVSVLVLARAA